MSNALFLLTNYVDSAQIAASSEIGTAPAENVQNTQRTKIWRSGFGTASHLDMTFQLALTATHVAIVDTNLTASGTIKVEAWDDALDGSTQTVNQTVAPSIFSDPTLPDSTYGDGLYGIGPYGAIDGYAAINEKNVTVIALSSAVTSKYWRITFTDANTSYQQTGRVYVGQATQFTYNLAYGWNFQQEIRTAFRESIGGQRFSQPRTPRQKFAVDFQYLTDDERTDTIIKLRQFGEYRPFIFSVFPEDTTQGQTTTLYGRFDGAQLTHANPAQNDFKLTVTEEL